MDGNEQHRQRVIATIRLTGGGCPWVWITQLKVAPFIVTLGTFSILRGAALMISTGPIGKATHDFLLLYDRRLDSYPALGSVPWIGTLPIFVAFFFVLLLLTVYLLRRTPFGRHIYALGGNEQVARLSGIRVSWVKLVSISCAAHWRQSPG
jgi:erythritol transport system permease protein